MKARIRKHDNERLREAKARFKGDEVTFEPFDSDNSPALELANAQAGRSSTANIPWMSPSNVDYYDRAIANRIENGFDMDDPADRKEYREILEATAHDKQKDKELADFRKFELTNDVMAAPFALGAFQTINLGESELPLIERPRSRNMQRFTVRSVSYDGGAHYDQWRTTKTAEHIQVETISTDRIEYPISDIQQGDISASADINRELRYDMTMKIDSLALANITASQSASGLRALLSIHPSVVQATIPDLNYLDLNAADTGILTLDKLKQILNHIALLTAAYADEGLVPTAMMMSPLNVRDVWDFVSLVSGVAGNEPVLPKNTVPDSVREQIFATGGISNAWGMRLKWVPNTQIAAGKMYVFFNKPLGWMFTKTSFDRVLTWDENNSPDHAEQNKGEIMWKRVLRFYVPDLFKHRVVIIDF